MESSFAPSRFDIFEFFRRFCDIMVAAYSRGSEGCISNDRFLRVELNQLRELVESTLHPRISILEEIHKLMMRLDLTANFSEFSLFYDFVFFISRENGQKNLSVSRAVTAWKLVLAGRFQLLDQWCKFVEDNQRHNIPEDTWKLVLSFSRCIQDNLESYDADGAWPILIDEFVEHMDRSRALNNSPNSLGIILDSESQSLKDSLRKFSSLTCSKRKLGNQLVENNNSVGGFTTSKRRQISGSVCVHCEQNGSVGTACECAEMLKHNRSFGCPESVEGYLSEGFAGLRTDSPSSRFGGKRRNS